MNTYDPADRIGYRHMNREPDPYAVPVTSTRSTNRLPVGYVNNSPRTRLAVQLARTA